MEIAWVDMWCDPLTMWVLIGVLVGFIALAGLGLWLEERSKKEKVTHDLSKNS